MNSGEVGNSQAGGDRWRWLVVATAILVLAAAMRLVALRDVPPGLAQDEVLDAGIALMVRQGQHALFFREGYGHEPLYHYLAAPFGGLLGVNFLSIRLPSVYLGLLLVALTMAWARREFGGLAAAVAGAGLAVGWWPLIFSRIGIRPILEPVLLVLMAWFWWKRPWLAGLLLALAVYSYTPARVMLGLPVLWLFYLIARPSVLRMAYSVSRKDRGTQGNSRNSGELQKPASNGITHHVSRFTSPLLALAVALVLSLPLYLTLRADPTLQQRVEQLSGPVDALRAGDWRPVMEATLATLGVFSVRGDPRWTYSLPGRPLFDPLTALLFYGGAAVALAGMWRRPAYSFTLIWLVVGLLPSAVTPDAPSTVRLVGAMPAVYALLGIGARGILDFGLQILDWQKSKIENPKSKIAAGWAVALLVLLGWNGARTVADGFGRWAAEVETGLRYQRAFLEIARQWQAEPAEAAVITDSFYEPIDHFSLWRTLGGPIPERWVQGGGAMVFPAGGAGRLYVPEYAPLTAVVVAAAGVPDTALYRSEERPSVAVYALPAGPAVELERLAVSFEQTLALAGYTVLPRQGDEPLHLLTYWRVERDSLPWDLAIFVHLVDSEGALVAQWDGLDAAASTLQAADHFLQLHSLPLPEERPAGPYTLQVGLYVRGDGRRLTHLGEPADRVILGERVVIDGR